VLFRSITSNIEDDKSKSSNNSGHRRGIPLPKINLPVFSGNLTTWMHFKDTFETLIVMNEYLSQIEKFHYLVSSLKGEAKDTIKNIALSESNFTVAYELLKNRYHCPKLIASEYVK
jgi:hypothetical protein